MKKIKQYLMLFLLLAAITSCEKDDTEPEQVTMENIEDIYGKWMVTGTNSIYKSFEFTDKGVCIVVENSSTKAINAETVRVGTYGIDDLGKGIVMLLEMNDSRVLDNILLTPESASFTVTDPADPDNAVTVESDRVEEIEDTEQTKLLARSWVLTRADWYDAEDGTTNTIEVPNGYRAVVALSVSGTYTTFTSNNGDEARKYGNWMWIDNTETAIWEWGNDVSFGDAKRITIITLSQDTFIVSTVVPDGEGDIVTEYFTLEPSGYYW